MDQLTIDAVCSYLTLLEHFLKKKNGQARQQMLFLDYMFFGRFKGTNFQCKFDMYSSLTIVSWFKHCTLKLKSSMLYSCKKPGEFSVAFVAAVPGLKSILYGTEVRHYV